MRTDREIQEALENILPPDLSAAAAAQRRWNCIAKPLHGLGKLEDLIVALAGIQRTDRVQINKKALVVMCADNGVVEEGVTQTGQEVTAIVAENFHKGETSAAILCAAAGADLFPVDVGMITDMPHVERRKLIYGTRNMT
nr:nicotinate-nucleotide--dimethylbenzimidazole phosphoribosyltransferase [Eubacterium sp.]